MGLIKRFVFICSFLFKLLIYIIKNGCKHSKKKKIYNNKKVNIIGNAPSFDFESLKNIKNSVNIMVNFSYKTDEFKKIKPNFLCIIDPKFYDDEKNQNSLIYVLSNIDWDLEIITLTHYKKSTLIKKIEEKNIRVNYIRAIEANGITNNTFLKFIYLHNLGAPIFQNVVVAALYFALQMGAKKISLYNVKLDMYTETVVDKENRIFLNDKHFYGSEKKMIQNFDMSSWLLAFSKMFLGFKQISKYAKQLNVTIVNKTEDSHIDVFEK